MNLHRGVRVARFLLLSKVFLASSVIHSNSWCYQGHPVAYDEVHSSSAPNESPAQEVPILLLNGFGVGSFHQHKLMQELVATDRQFGIYCVDYLGQGNSWPDDCNDGKSEQERGLAYSADLWIQQLIAFLEEVVIPQQGKPCKVHLVGNSVGGYVASFMAEKRPDLIESICLLNATPVWGLNLPFWSGRLPAPKIPLFIGGVLFDWIRDLRTLRRYLGRFYTHNSVWEDNKLDLLMRNCTTGKGGRAAFCSILWSPPASTTSGSRSFYDCLSNVKCDVLLIFGKDDPVCKPALAKRMLRALDSNPDGICRYLEMESVGHSPNHEAPRAVARILGDWVVAPKRSPKDLKLLDGESEGYQESWGETVVHELGEKQIPMSLTEKIITKFV